jgi:hypothetical protein
VDANRSSEDTELDDALEALGRPEAVTIRQVVSKAGSELADMLQEKKNRRVIPQWFEKCGYITMRNPNSEKGLWRIAGVKQVIYVLSTLSVKGQYKSSKRADATWRKFQII